MGTACHENYIALLGFSRADKSVPDTTRGVVLYGGESPISGQPDSRGWCTPNKEKRTLPRTPADVSEVGCVTALDTNQYKIEMHQSPWAGSGILTRFPFATGGCLATVLSSNPDNVRHPVSVPIYRIT